jgi:hypothetical protein
MNTQWPDGKCFAFTIFDDTDWATVENVKPVYDLLTELGIRTTKSVWVFPARGRSVNGGATCEDKDYLRWVLSLQDRGFQIALHNVSPGTSFRDQTRAGLDRFRSLFGDRMLVHCNHTGCLESIYWGDARLGGWRRAIYNLATRGRRRGVFRGHVEGDPLFWGDLCQERVSYVRNFVFDDLNTLSVCPEMPYHDPGKPFVNYWFASANGASLKRFLGNFSFNNIDRLVAQGGLCIAYVHFAAGFSQSGRVDQEFKRRLEYLASQNGWFAPVSDVLDFLRGGEPVSRRAISPNRLRSLDLRWLFEKLLRGTS